MTDDSGSSAILGVIVGVLIVAVILFFVFGGWGWMTGTGGEVNVDLNVR
jgi:amino acid transporter